MTVHADEEMDSDGLSIRHVEECLLSGRVIGRQDRTIETICKLGHGGNLIIITLYAVD